MDPPAPDELLDRLRALEPGRVALEHLTHQPSRVYLVGGAVRDLLRGQAPRELDLVTEGDAIALAQTIPRAQVVAHGRFGTATFRLDGHLYDIATARRETYDHPGALPTVASAPLEQDLRRRDFTINAIAMALDTGALESHPGALDDLQAQTLRVLHDKSFLDDPTRLLRLARYASRLGFTIDPHTRDLAATAVQNGALETVSGPRIGAELRLLLREADPLAALDALRALELDRAIDPYFGLSDAAPARKALELLPADGRADLLALAAAAEDVPAPRLRELLDRLGFEATDRERTVAAAGRARSVAQALKAAQRPSEIAAAVAGASPELVALAGGHSASAQAARWLDELRHVKLEIHGGDLIEAGVPQGPQIGRALHAALEAKLDGRTGGREDELAAALEAV